MTIYDILDKLIRGDAFHGFEQDQALEVIARMRQMSSLGTATAQTASAGHECVPFDTRAALTNCTICDRRMCLVNGAYV